MFGFQVAERKTTAMELSLHQPPPPPPVWEAGTEPPETGREATVSSARGRQEQGPSRGSFQTRCTSATRETLRSPYAHARPLTASFVTIAELGTHLGGH